MIELIIEQYCKNCPDFEPDVVKETYADGFRGEVRTQTTIKCINYDRCKAMYKRIKAEMTP